MQEESHLLIGVPDDHDGGLVLVNPVEEGGQGYSMLIGGVNCERREYLNDFKLYNNKCLLPNVGLTEVILSGNSSQIDII